MNDSTSPTASSQLEPTPTHTSPQESILKTAAASPSLSLHSVSPKQLTKVESVAFTYNNVTSELSRTDEILFPMDKGVKAHANTKTDSSSQTNVEEEPNQKINLLGNSISVGTDNVSEFSQDDSINSPAAKVEIGTSLPGQTKALSQNLINRTGHFSNLERSVSQSELRDDLTFPGRQYANECRENFNRGQLLRSLSRASLISEPGMYGLQDEVIRSPESPFLQRKGLGTDWRKRRSSDFSNRDYIPQQHFQVSDRGSF